MYILIDLFNRICKKERKIYSSRNYNNIIKNTIKQKRCNSGDFYFIVVQFLVFLKISWDKKIEKHRYKTKYIYIYEKTFQKTDINDVSERQVRICFE